MSDIFIPGLFDWYVQTPKTELTDSTRDALAEMAKGRNIIGRRISRGELKRRAQDILDVDNDNRAFNKKLKEEQRLQKLEAKVSEHRMTPAPEAHPKKKGGKK